MTGAEQLVGLVTDEASFHPWDTDLVSTDPLDFTDTRPYRERLTAAADRAGTSEAVVTGQARLGGQPLVVIAGEFAFLAGSVGVATGERVARAFDRAVHRRLPVLALAASGGTRMQEGTPAFVQMIKTAAAAARLREAGVPYVSYLRHPTMGGVLASWASLAHVTFAEPGALIGFTGPRVLELTTGRRLPDDVQTAENLLRRGLVDDVVAEHDVRSRVARVLAVVAGEVGEPVDPRPPAPPAPPPSGTWESVRRSRAAGRPGAGDLLDACATEVTALRGDGCGDDDPACYAALARVHGVPAVVVAQDRTAGEGRLGPSGFRKARRAMGIAGELGIPLVTVIDTPGARVSREAEEGGLAAEIARCLATMSTLPCPTVAVMLGPGTGGGAIALLPADRVLCAEHAWLAPIAPEGASAILYRTTDHAAGIADAQGVAAADLARFGIVDAVVSEDDLIAGMAGALEAALRALISSDAGARLAARARRHRTIATPDAPARRHGADGA